LPVPPALDTGERYDLVVVGAGISGLAAAYFYRQKYGQDKRILLLDNHDDFGGHARRNEFHQAGEMRLAWGGTVNIEFPMYSDVAMGLVRDLGIDIERLREDFNFTWANHSQGLQTATWFGADKFGRDVLIPGMGMDGEQRLVIAGRVDEFPISSAARAGLKNFLLEESDLLAGMTADEKIAWAHSHAYPELLRLGGVPDEAIVLFSGSTMGYWGVRAENLSVMECLWTSLPGAHRLGELTAEFAEDEDSSTGVPGGQVAMFPDGNASMTRLLVRALIPAFAPDLPAGADPHNIVTTRVDYSALDCPGAAARLRLNSTVLNVENQPRGRGVAVRYANAGNMYAVNARQVVMACYNRIIPHLVPALPEAQKAALRQCIKRPMMVINVLVRNGKSIRASGLSGAYLPGRLVQNVRLVQGLNTGGYSNHFDPEKPVVLQFFAGVAAPAPEGLSVSEQHQAARAMLLAMPFEDYEREVRTVMNGVYGSAGFEAARDILAITVNRWPHGYARDHLDLEDELWNADPPPNVVGRQVFGNIAIANSDAGADAYTHTAIDQAWRAVNDLAT
jgi:spermidine dehydrogenase